VRFFSQSIGEPDRRPQKAGDGFVVFGRTLEWSSFDLRHDWKSR
jgi:hypothetical protein